MVMHVFTDGVISSYLKSGRMPDFGNCFYQHNASLTVHGELVLDSHTKTQISVYVKVILIKCYSIYI